MIDRRASAPASGRDPNQRGRSLVVEPIVAAWSGHLAAGLDATAEEPLADDSPCGRCQTCVITPHVGGQSARRIDDMTDSSAKTCTAVPPANRWPISSTSRWAIPCRTNKPTLKLMSLSAFIGRTFGKPEHVNSSSICLDLSGAVLIAHNRHGPHTHAPAKHPMTS